MRIALIDVDGKAQKKKHWGGTAHPNLALCKIAAYHKAKGDVVEWYDPLFGGHYDKAYMSKVFNFSEDYPYYVDADEVIKGGTGYDLRSKLQQEIDDTQPDLSFYPMVPQDTAYGFLTRGCPNKCNWCVVPRKEGAIKPYWSIERVLNGKKKAVLMDNNILAAGDYCMKQLAIIAETGVKVDFNQALDARLVTDEIASYLARIKWLDNRIRFGCDTTAQIDECERAIAMIQAHGYTGQFFLYTMIGGGTRTLTESYERIHHWWERNHAIRLQHKGNAIYPHAQPYRDPVNPNHTIPQWQKDMAGWCNKRMLFEKFDFMDFSPRKGFVCSEYFKK